MTAYSIGAELKNAIIGHDNPGWDHFISMNDSKNFESASYNGGDNIVISTFPTNADPALLNKWIVMTVTWSPQLGADG